MFKLNKMHVLGGVAFSMMAVSTGWAQSTEPVQNFPSKPITVVVTFPPGGPLDVVARVMAEKLGTKHGRTIVVENRAGGRILAEGVNATGIIMGRGDFGVETLQHPGFP